MYFNATPKFLHKLIIPALVFITLTAPAAWATNSIKTRFLTAYPSATGTRLVTLNGVAHCGACHYDFSGGGTLNPYGDAMLTNGYGTTAAILAIGSQDSDGDGFNNKTEITDANYSNYPTFPGLKSSNVSLVSNLPTGITVAYLSSYLTPSGIADTAPPTPNPATFATAPNATGTTSIAMVATTGSDPCGPVQYLFTETSGHTGGTSSAWQTSTSYTDTGLTPGTLYTYTVTMRDNLGNTGTASAPASATTNAAADTAPPTPNPATFATAPNATGTTSIAMVATTGSDPCGPVRYLFTETSGHTGGTSSAWQTSTSYTDIGLTPGTLYTYTVTMRDNLGNTGTASAPASATTAEVPSAYWQLYNAASLIIADSNGVPVTFSLTGGGWGEIIGENFDQIILHNTTESSVFSIKTPVKQETSVGDIIVGDSTDTNGLKSILAGTTDLRGDIAIQGSVGRIELDDVDSDHIITIGPSSNPQAGVVLKFDEVYDLIIESDTPIKSLTCTQWLDTDANQDYIKAPSLGTLQVRGDAKRGIAGDFEADLYLGGITVDSEADSDESPSQVIGDTRRDTADDFEADSNKDSDGSTSQNTTLANVEIAGEVRNCIWNITGNVGNIRVGSSSTDWEVNVDGDVKSLKTRRSKNSNSNGGNLSVIWKSNSLKRVSIAGDITDTLIYLTQTPDPEFLALGHMNVSGWIDGSEITCSGNIGKVATGGISNSSIFAGDIAGADNYKADGVRDLPNPTVPGEFGDAAIGELTVKGIKGESYGMINSNIAARRFNTVLLAYPQYENGGVAFGVVADFIEKITLKDQGGTLSYSNLDAPSDSKQKIDAVICVK